MKQPLVIFVGESDHGDMHYGELVRSIAGHSKNVQIFSEFSSQAEKVRTQNLKNHESQTFQETVDFLSEERLIKMGDLQERDAANKKLSEMISGIKPSVLKDLKESELQEIEKGNLTINEDGSLSRRLDGDGSKLADRIEPELKELFSQELEEKIKAGDQPLRNFLWWVGGFLSPEVHNKMTEDVKNNLDPNSDVVIIVAGSPHLPALGRLLEDDFGDSKKFVISNPSGQTNYSLLLTDSSYEALSRVGEFVSFEIDGRTKLPKIPNQVLQAIDDQKAIEAMGENNFAKKFASERKAREAEDVPWADRVASRRLESRDDSAVR